MYSVVHYVCRVSGLEYIKKLGNNLMPAQSFGVIYLMGSVLARIRLFIDNLGHKETAKRSKEAGKFGEIFMASFTCCNQHCASKLQ